MKLVSSDQTIKYLIRVYPHFCIKDKQSCQYMTFRFNVLIDIDTARNFQKSCFRLFREQSANVNF